MTNRRIVAGIALLTALAAAPGPVRAQLKIGQYEDEAPLRTWNSAPFSLAAALGRGGTSMTLAADPSAALANPALLPLLSRFSVAIQGYYETGTMAKAGPIGTGVFLIDGNTAAVGSGLDYAGAAVRAGRWGFSVGISQEESYLRPTATYTESAPAGGNGYFVEWSQSGRLRIANAALGVILGRGLSFGLGVNWAFGRLGRSFVERITGRGGWEVSDAVSQDIGGWFVNGGLLWSPTSGFRAAAVFRTPYSRKAEARSVLGYKAPDGNTDIAIEAASTDSARQPLVAGLGVSLDISPALTLAVEASFFGWAAYALDVFGEAQERDFRNVARLNVGLEIREKINLFGTVFDVPSRVGLIYDPQPMKDPASAYGDVTIGTGLAAGRFRLDLAALFGREWGSGNGLVARRIAVALGFRL
jgi:hypothetical protein